MNFDSKMDVEMNLMIFTKNHAGDPETGLITNRFQSCMAAQGPGRQRGR